MGWNERVQLEKIMKKCISSGAALTKKEDRFLSAMLEKYPKQYKQLHSLTKEACKPFGAR